MTHVPLDPGQLYRVLAESASDAIITIDESSTVLSLNPAGERLFGYRASEVIGRSLAMLMPERMRGPHVAGIQRYLSTGVRNIPWQAVRVPIQRNDGTEVPVEISFGEFTTDGRRLFSGILRDLTIQLAAETALEESAELMQQQATELEHQVEEAQVLSEELEQANAQLHETYQQLQAREAEIRALANAIPALTFMARPDGSRFWLNDRWMEYTGWAHHELEGWGWLGVHDPDFRTEVKSRWEHAVATGTVFEMEFPLRRADGVYRWFLSRAVPALDGDGQPTRWFGTNTDIQDHREAIEAANAANAAKTQFLAAMSHETRQPINATLSFLQLLELDLYGPLTTEQRDALQRIRKNQEQLLAVLTDVLSFARLDAGRVELRRERVPLTEVLADLPTLLEPQVLEHGLTLAMGVCDPGMAVLGDKRRILQICTNLVTNATRASTSGDAVQVRCREDGAWAMIDVEDSGEGIPADKLDEIFTPFVQLDRALNKPRSGAGLGLPISRDLARGMGGDILVRSEVGRGSVFTLRLPRDPEPDA